MTTAPAAPPADAVTAYWRVVASLAAGADVCLTTAVEAARAIGKTTADMSDDVCAVAARLADDDAGETLPMPAREPADAGTQAER